MKLTAKTIQGIEPGPKPQKVAADGGLYLYVTPNGRKTWRLDYREDGKRKTATLGQWPGMTVPMAEAKRDELKVALRKGADPSVPAQPKTVKDLLDEWLARKRKKWAPATTKRYTKMAGTIPEWLLRKEAGSLTQADFFSYLNGLSLKGHYEKLHRMTIIFRGVMRVARNRGLLTTDPLEACLFDADFEKASSLAARYPAITDETEFAKLLQATWNARGMWGVVYGLRFQIYLMLRPNEARGLLWSEVNDDSVTISTERTKMRKPLHQPMPWQAVEVIKTAEKLNLGSDYVFESDRGGMVSQAGPNMLLARAGYTGDIHVPHGFRASASTILNERGFDPLLIELALGHETKTAIEGRYNRSTRVGAKRELLQAWADIVDELLQLEV